MFHINSLEKKKNYYRGGQKRFLTFSPLPGKKSLFPQNIKAIVSAVVRVFITYNRWEWLHIVKFSRLSFQEKKQGVVKTDVLLQFALIYYLKHSFGRWSLKNRSSFCYNDGHKIPNKCHTRRRQCLRQFRCVNLSATDKTFSRWATTIPHIPN